MASEARNEYLRATFTLSKSDPAAWENFYVAFDTYAKSELEKATATSTDEMAVSLGMSRRMINLRNDFRDIQDLMAKVTK